MKHTHEKVVPRETYTREGVSRGTYEKPTFGSQLAIYRAQKKKEERAREVEKLQKRRELNNVLIDVYREYMHRSDPLSEVWCDCCNALQYQLYLHEILNEMEGRM